MSDIKIVEAIELIIQNQKRLAKVQGELAAELGELQTQVFELRLKLLEILGADVRANPEETVRDITGHF